MKGENEKKKCIFKVFSLLLLIFTIFTLLQFNNRKVENPDLLKRGLWWFDKKVSWRKCGELECASISVPLDHRDLHSPKIKISIVKYRAVVQPAVSTLFVNPGGPSASGKDFLIATGNEFSALFEGKVDFIGVDPRGVGDSTPKIDCAGFGQNTSFMANGFSVFGAQFLPNNSTVSQQRYFDATMRLNAKLCELNTGDFLKFTTTAHIANDLDYIRQALELEKLNYWGFNYGTVLGLTYANMFPERVGNIILDSVINPNEYFKSALDSLKNTDLTLAAVMDECDKFSSCPLYKEGKPWLMLGKKSIDTLNDLRNQLAEQPLIEKNDEIPGVLTADMVDSLLFDSLHSSWKWDIVSSALKSATLGNIELLYDLSKSNDFDSTNDQEKLSVISAVLCADEISSNNISLESWMQNIYSEKTSLLAGHQWGSKFLGCRHWVRYQNQYRYTGPWNQTMANPLLIIANTFDPISPMSSALDTHDLLKRSDGTLNSVILKNNAIGHGSTSHSSQCSVNHIKRYILEGVLPPKDSICQPDVSLFAPVSQRPDEITAAVKFINERLLEVLK